MTLREWSKLLRDNRQRLLDEELLRVITVELDKLVALSDWLEALERAALYASGQSGMMTASALQMLREAIAKGDVIV